MTEINIPGSVVKIGDSAFFKCSSLKEIELPDGIEKIAVGAFSGCAGLHRIRIPDQVKEIEGEAFAGCENLRELILPDGITAEKIASNAFTDCRKLAGEDGWFILHNRVFCCVSREKHITVPDGIEEICTAAFSGQASVETIWIPDSVTKICPNAFEGCASLKTVRLPSGLTAVEDYTFRNCTSLEEIQIPDLTKKIGWSAFEGCASLKRASLPSGLKEIEGRAFLGCSSLEEIQIPPKVKEIGRWAFQDCTSLKSLELPKSVKRIGEEAFSGCSSLRRLAFPDHVSIERFIISGCSSLEEVNASPEFKKEWFGSFNVRVIFERYHERFHPNLIREIFSNLKEPVKNKKAMLAMFIESDDAGALQTLLDMKYVANTKVRDELIELASSQGKTESLAVLLAYKERTGNRAKEEKAREKKLNRELNMSEEELLKKAMKELWNFRFVSTKTKSEYEIRGYKGSEKVVEVPGEIGGIPVTQIADKVFSSYWHGERFDKITEIIIPDSIKEIGELAFNGCKSLKKVQLPSCLDFLGSGAFMGCGALERIQLPEIRSEFSVNKMFKDCSSLKEIAVSPSKTEINTSDFAYCTSLTDVVIPAHVTAILGWAFHSCYNLQAVHIHKNVKKIYKTAFENCSQLTIYAPAGSYAEKYAKENEIPFVEEES